MNSLMKKVGLGVALAATALTTAVPAEAQRWRGGNYGRGYYHGDRGGTAVVAGIAGLAIGAAIASNNRDRYERDAYYRDNGYHAYYDDGYYRDHGYYPNDGYYAYRARDRYDYNRCYVERRWDRYYDRPVDVRVCR